MADRWARSFFLKNEATELIDNKRSASDEQRNEATVLGRYGSAQQALGRRAETVDCVVQDERPPAPHVGISTEQSEGVMEKKGFGAETKLEI